MKVRFLWRSILHICLPATCFGCRRDLPLRRRHPLCVPCENQIRPAAPDDPMSDAFEKIYVPFSFSGPFRDLIHAFKYRGQDVLAKWLVDLWMRRTPFDSPAVEAIVPIPMTPWKEMTRGFNPSVLLAKELNRRWGIPVVGNALRCRSFKKSQTRLNRRGRWENARSNFTPTPLGARLKGRTVLLIDDVLTTGATLRACAFALKKCGVSRNFGTALAYEEFRAGSRVD